MAVTEPYYQDDWVTIYHGDCLEVDEWLSADVLVTDPPYGVNLTEKLYKEGSAGLGTYGVYQDTPENHAKIVVPAIQRWADTGKRGAVTPGTKRMLEMPTPAHVGAFACPAGTGRASWGFNLWQPIMYYGKDPYLADGKGSRPDSYFYKKAIPSSYEHPVAKPMIWMEWLVRRVSREGETIADPFMGSGTTLVAAKAQGRKSIGVEIEERYCEVAAKRCAQDYLFGEALRELEAQE